MHFGRWRKLMGALQDKLGVATNARAWLRSRGHIGIAAQTAAMERELAGTPPPLPKAAPAALVPPTPVPAPPAVPEVVRASVASSARPEVLRAEINGWAGCEFAEDVLLRSGLAKASDMETAAALRALHVVTFSDSRADEDGSAVTEEATLRAQLEKERDPAAKAGLARKLRALRDGGEWIGVLILLLLTILPARAQQGIGYSGSTTQQILSGGTNKAVALSTNWIPQIDLSRQEFAALFCNYSFLNAPAGGDSPNIRIDFFRGITAGTFETNAWFSWTVPGNSTTAAAQATNINVGSIPFLRARVANVGTNAHATNLSLTLNWKR